MGFFFQSLPFHQENFITSRFSLQSSFIGTYNAETAKYTPTLQSLLHQLMFLKSLMSCDIVVCPGNPVCLI